MNQLFTRLSLLMLLAVGFIQVSEAQVSLQFLGRFSTGYYNLAAAEISAYDAGTKRLFVANSADTSIKIVDLSNPANPTLISSISLKSYKLTPFILNPSSLIRIQLIFFKQIIIHLYFMNQFHVHYIIYQLH